MNNESLNILAITFAMSGLWDTIAGVMYIFFFGSGRTIDHLAIHPFFSVFPGSLLLGFACLQCMSAINIKRYALNVGCLIFGIVFHVVLLYSFMASVKDFPATFWVMGSTDSVSAILYVVFAVRGGLNLYEVFLPKMKVEPKFISTH